MTTVTDSIVLEVSLPATRPESAGGCNSPPADRTEGTRKESWSGPQQATANARRIQTRSGHVRLEPLQYARNIWQMPPSKTDATYQGELIGGEVQKMVGLGTICIL